ncbi:DUF4286 family protein [bacterium]|nr:DUF4286 family protein [bacterium]NBX82255.1 DUF4286 family protein [bacterium]
MIVYEVNAEVEASVADAYREWIGPHVEHILKLPGFVSGQVFEELGREHLPSRKFTVQYLLKNREDLEAYLNGPAQELRKEAMEKFGNQLTLTRRHLAVLLEKK